MHAESDLTLSLPGGKASVCTGAGGLESHIILVQTDNTCNNGLRGCTPSGLLPISSPKEQQ